MNSECVCFLGTNSTNTSRTKQNGKSLKFLKATIGDFGHVLGPLVSLASQDSESKQGMPIARKLRKPWHSAELYGVSHTINKPHILIHTHVGVLKRVLIHVHQPVPMYDKHTHTQYHLC